LKNGRDERGRGGWGKRGARSLRGIGKERKRWDLRRAVLEDVRRD